MLFNIIDDQESCSSPIFFFSIEKKIRKTHEELKKIVNKTKSL